MKYRRVALILLVLVVLIVGLPKRSYAPQGAVEESKATGIAELLTAIDKLGIGSSSSDDEELQTKRKELEEQFLDLTGELIKREQSIQTSTSSVLFWTNVSAQITFILAHVFLVFGIWLGSAELRRAYRLRKKGAAEKIDVQISAEGVALKSSLYGFLVFGASLTFYSLYLRFVYPVIIIGGE